MLTWSGWMIPQEIAVLATERLWQRVWMTTVLTGLLGLCAYAQRGERYDLSWWTIDAGGVTFGGDAVGRLLIGGTFGQPDASEYLTDAFERFELRGGFWYTVPTETGCTPAGGDVDGDGCVDDADLLQVLFAFGETGSNPADSNCDGQVDDADCWRCCSTSVMGVSPHPRPLSPAVWGRGDAFLPSFLSQCACAPCLCGGGRWAFVGDCELPSSR